MQLLLTKTPKVRQKMMIATGTIHKRPAGDSPSALAIDNIQPDTELVAVMSNP